MDGGVDERVNVIVDVADGDAATKDEVLIIKCCFPLCLPLFRISYATTDDRTRRRAMTSAAMIPTRIPGIPMIGSTGKRIA